MVMSYIMNTIKMNGRLVYFLMIRKYNQDKQYMLIIRYNNKTTSINSIVKKVREHLKKIAVWCILTSILVLRWKLLKNINIHSCDHGKKVC